MIYDFKLFCDKSDLPVVVILVEHGLLEDVLFAVALKIDQTEFNPVVVLTESRARLSRNFANGKLDSIPVFVSDTVDFSSIDTISVAVVSDIDYDRPAFSYKTKVIACPHYFSEYMASDDNITLNRLRLVTRLLPHCDALFVAQAELGNLNYDECEKLFNNVLPAAGQRREGLFTLIKGGYLKADLVRERVEAEQVEKDIVLIAPTSLSMRNFTVEQHQNSWYVMLQSALNSLPDAKIIFRFHPFNWEDRLVKKFMEEFSGLDRVVFDTNPSTIPSFTRAKVYLTNGSAGRITFSIATDIPNIMYKPHKGGEIARFGFLVRSQLELEKTLRECYSNSSLMQKEILKQRESEVLGVGKSFEILLDSIKALAFAEDRSYWTSFERRYVSGDWSSAHDWREWWKSTTLPGANAIPDHIREYLVSIFPEGASIPLPLVFHEGDNI